MKILVCPDSFKNSMTSTRVCEIISKALTEVYPQLVITNIPLADGGEGSLESIANIQDLKWEHVDSIDSLSRPIKSSFLISEKEKKAYIELAKCSGLELITIKERNPRITSTRGTGKEILKALQLGAKEIVLFLGGSATNDAGTGILATLGFKFLNDRGIELLPNGENLIHIFSIVPPENIEELYDIKFTLATDVTNPFSGTNGAAHVYAKQKGANESDIVSLEKGLVSFNEIVRRQYSIDLNHINGTGAAGGVAGGLFTFLNSEIVSGFTVLADFYNLEKELRDSDLIITGEGKFDAQSSMGKIVGRIIELSSSMEKPLVVISGGRVESRYSPKNVQIHSLQDKNMSSEESIQNAEKLLFEKVKSLSKIYFDEIKKASS